MKLEHHVTSQRTNVCDVIAALRDRWEASVSVWHRKLDWIRFHAGSRLIRQLSLIIGNLQELYVDLRWSRGGIDETCMDVLNAVCWFWIVTVHLYRGRVIAVDKRIHRCCSVRSIRAVLAWVTNGFSVRVYISDHDRGLHLNVGQLHEYRNRMTTSFSDVTNMQWEAVTYNYAHLL